ncbi:MAG: tetratricopeptide repeat protein [Candidatus Sericytochromatia bacterium]|nr:tetratricopeptide repeat protein [Candidatus Sericytochromatia bacterium]
MTKILKNLLSLLLITSSVMSNLSDANAETKKVNNKKTIKKPKTIIKQQNNNNPKNTVNNSQEVNTKEDIDPVFNLGSIAYDEQKYDDAIVLFKKIIDKFPGYGDAHYYIGLSYFSLGKYYLSIASFLEANKIYGNKKSDALFGAGLSYLSAGYNDEARAAFQKVIKESSDTELVEDSKNWISSIDEQILQKDKIDLLTTDINFREGIEYLDAQDYTKAEIAFKSATMNKPNSLLVLYYLGNTQYLKENYKDSIETFNKILLINPESKIASDAKLYIRVIDDITATLPSSRPYFVQLSLGGLYDTNLSYSDLNDTIISDISGIGSLTLGYNFNNNIQAQYSYYTNIFSGINDKTVGLNIHSYDFNLQRHNTNLKFNYSIFSNLLAETDFSGNWYILAGSNFLFNGKVNPRLSYYLTSNIITVLQYSFDINNYPVFNTRNSFNHSLDLSQYFYFLNNTMWLRLGYNLQKTNANDKLQVQSGALKDENKYDLSYNFTNSLISNDLSADLSFNLFLNSKLKLNAKVSYNNYDSPDIYKLTSPVTNITTGKTETKVLKDLSKQRFDTLYNIGFSYSIPVYNNLSASLSYNYLNNISNITSNDYIGRSYSKHLFGLNLIYDF